MRNTEPFGCLLLASEYIKAASMVQPAPSTEIEVLRQKVSLPAYFLLGHAIELSLKAFLLGRGIGIKELRSRKYGHDLSSLLAQARRRQLGREVKLVNKESEAICLLSECYAVKELEYSMTGLRRLPSYRLTHVVAEKLCLGLRGYVRRVGA